jgi:hypothetical protein
MLLRKNEKMKGVLDGISRRRKDEIRRAGMKTASYTRQRGIISKKDDPSPYAAGWTAS